MCKEIRFKFKQYLALVAELNDLSPDEVAKKLPGESSVTQTLVTNLQMSSAFLIKINIVQVDELKMKR
ncbi:Phage major capsid protein%2C P2 family [Serratia marcescens]|nr:P2 family phage major capsid protein [Serratia marcescens]CUY66305.1 Phage major capsid protein%2C P2 family [Serratia marcescens]